MSKLSAEEKLIIAIHAEEVFAGKTVNQAFPYCCGQKIDIYNTDIRFPELQVGSRKFTMLEPKCPSCGRWVRPAYVIVH